MSAMEVCVRHALDAGVAPGDIAQAVLEQCHRAPLQPCGDGVKGQKCRVTSIDEAKGTIAQMIMGPDSDYVLTLGPQYYLHGRVEHGNGTTILTIKREPAE